MSEEPKGDLQFDRADFEGAPKANTLCSVCGQTLWNVYYTANGRVLCEQCKTDLELAAHEGSGLGRFLRATLYGVGAGAVGSGVWFAVRAATGYEVGLIAVAVGFMVGAAVRKGSNGRGGWPYQALAMVLTYGSIVSAYVPVLLTELNNVGQKPPALFLIAVAFAAPFLGGFENVIGIVIIGIGVYEAWKINKRQAFEITGPHRVGTAEHG